MTSEKPGYEPRRCLTRRRFLAGCLAGLGSGALGAAYACHIEPFWPRLERVPMDLPRLDPALSGLRLLHLSDLHLSRTVPPDYLHTQLKRCTARQPDLIVITGDFVTRGATNRFGELGRLLKCLHARHGAFAVLGNHDYNCSRSVSGQRRPRGRRSADRVAAELAAAGIEVLRNECRRLALGAGQLQLVGVEDYWSGYYDPQSACAAVDPQLPCIALCHNPDAITDLKNLPCHWVLSGHTHGGQVRLPLLGAPILPVRNRQYDAGLFDVQGTRLYVNRGLGHLYRIRFNCRPEITEFTLQPRA